MVYSGELKRTKKLAQSSKEPQDKFRGGFEIGTRCQFKLVSCAIRGQAQRMLVFSRAGELPNLK